MDPPICPLPTIPSIVDRDRHYGSTAGTPIARPARLAPRAHTRRVPHVDGRDGKRAPGSASDSLNQTFAAIASSVPGTGVIEPGGQARKSGGQTAGQNLDCKSKLPAGRLDLQSSCWTAHSSQPCQSSTSFSHTRLAPEPKKIQW